MKSTDAHIPENDTASLRRRGYILTRLDNDTVAWVNEDVAVTIDREKKSDGYRWTAHTREGELLGFGPTVDLLLRRILPAERVLTITDEGLRAVSEVAERVLHNERAVGPMSTGEVIAAALIFDRRD